MRRQLAPAILSIIVFTILLGFVYPLVVTAIAQVAFNDKADGSLIEVDREIVGSELIGQTFTAPGYFWSRPSAVDYDGGGSAGSNLGPTNPALEERVATTVATLRETHGDSTAIPVDIATASASGLDPHITPAAALYQVERVAAARGLSVEIVRRLVDDHVESRQLGFLGEPRVNVLLLNLALDETAPRVRPVGATATAVSVPAPG
jgi:K+-transporting ATPase ATPase C chain